MKTKSFLIIAVISFLISCQSHIKQSRSKDIKKLFMTGIKYFNAHNLDGFMQQFAVDIEMYTPTGWLRGKTNVRKRFSKTFIQFPHVKMEIENLQVKEINNETIITNFKWRVYPMGQGPAFHGIGSGVYILRGNSWVEVLEHETITKTDAKLKIEK